MSQARTIGICIIIIIGALVVRESLKKDSQLTLPARPDMEGNGAAAVNSEVEELRAKLKNLEQDHRKKVAEAKGDDNDGAKKKISEKRRDNEDNEEKKPATAAPQQEAAAAEKKPETPVPGWVLDNAVAAAPAGGQTKITKLEQKLEKIFEGELEHELNEDKAQDLRSDDHVPLCYEVVRDILSVQLPSDVGGNPKNMSQKYDPEDPYPDIGMCPLTRRVVCQKGVEKKEATDPETGKPKIKGKALILVSFHGFDRDDQPAEAGNVDFFNQFGLIPEDYPTALFDAVDFVFYRTSHARVENALGDAGPNGNPDGVANCTSVGNVRYVWMKGTPGCSYCPLSKVLTFLGFNPDLDLTDPASFEAWPYRSITHVETDYRGPFLNEWSRGGAGSQLDRPVRPSYDDEENTRPSGRFSSWVDISAMAGRPRRPLYLNDEMAAARKVQGVTSPKEIAAKLPDHLRLAFFNDADASTMNWEIKPHLQKGYLTVSRTMMQAFFKQVTASCSMNTQGAGCVKLNDAGITEALIKDSGLPASIYYRGQNWRQFASTDLEAKKGALGFGGGNPISRGLDPCDSLFITYGTQVEQLPKTTRRSVSFLSGIMTSEFGPSLPLEDRREILAGTARCGWYVRPYPPGVLPNAGAETKVMNLGRPADGQRRSRGSRRTG